MSMKNPMTPAGIEPATFDLMPVLQLNSEVGMGLCDSTLDYMCHTKIWIFYCRFSSKVNANLTL